MKKVVLSLFLFCGISSLNIYAAEGVNLNEQPSSATSNVEKLRELLKQKKGKNSEINALNTDISKYNQKKKESGMEAKFTSYDKLSAEDKKKYPRKEKKKNPNNLTANDIALYNKYVKASTKKEELITAIKAIEEEIVTLMKQFSDEELKELTEEEKKEIGNFEQYVASRKEKKRKAAANKERLAREAQEADDRKKEKQRRQEERVAEEQRAKEERLKAKKLEKERKRLEKEEAERQKTEEKEEKKEETSILDSMIDYTKEHPFLVGGTTAGVIIPTSIFSYKVVKKHTKLIEQQNKAKKLNMPFKYEGQNLWLIAAQKVSNNGYEVVARQGRKITTTIN